MKKRRRRWLICIDPGKTTGLAVFCDGVLVACRKMTPEWFFGAGLFRQGGKDVTVLVEIPRIYPLERSQVPPNDLIDTAQLAGQYQGYFLALGAAVESVFPRTWKGTIPKPRKLKGESRGVYIIEERALEALTSAERGLIHQTRSARSKYLDHNMIDAVGMGLWRLKRRKNEVNNIHTTAGRGTKKQQNVASSRAGRQQRRVVRNTGDGRARRAHGELQQGQAC